METKQKERIRRLMELLKKTDRIHLKEAARMLEVSVMTIRRDLSQDDEPLPLTLLGGYIVMVNKPATLVNAPLPVQKQYHRDDLPVAILAAGLVSENDLVFFDNGAEMPLVVSMIPDDITFTGICYSHRVFVALNEKPNATVILCGGTYRAKSDAFYDTSNPSPLDALNPRKVFISASGVHEHFGVSWFNPDDLATKRKAMERGLRKILLTRHALFDEVAPASIGPLSTFDVLISDRPLPADYATHCRNGSVKVITPDSDGD
ncbi:MULTISPECIES: DeoR family transcriptional regulator [Citrobacter]|jgi:DeoR family deoxyribose operon repressor|uniref:DeoR family transcriptional regulator n=1 Tax=Citrobacter braakii TaxID=57706 RepID=A0A1V8NYL9_CITBR|nr:MULTISPECIES: DeoR family transcriptional regulator [Citrobacter]KKC61707.1 DeoR faimly transcriptional regulator [Citrobacter amalonaticus]MCW1433437.1 DeoR family transcriptional regulator [Citrobacter freundii]TKV23395.1 DeoR family transcriptional regulator [Citrobacter sp. TBCS-11]ASE43636.1 DeoR family transcriptional regulator [Citrobacter braakii]AUV28736.1 DeoR family transcriptional regulator [Citrobacter freundii complex sp. CFNIH3]